MLRGGVTAETLWYRSVAYGIQLYHGWSNEEACDK